MSTSALLSIKNKGNLSHAYFLWGYGPLEEKIAIVEDLLRSFEPAPFTDALIMFPADGVIGIESVREAQRFIWQKPARSPRKTVIITDIASLTREAQDAFLKTVEEPPSHGLLVFIGRDPAFLSPALESRFQKIYVPHPGDLIVSEDDAAEAVEFVAASASGRKEIIKQIMERDTHAQDAFGAAVMALLDRDPHKNWKALKEMGRRFGLMGRHTTNRKLQWEAISSYL